MKRTLILLLTSLGMLELAGCNTKAGLDKETQAAGRSLENVAKK